MGFSLSSKDHPEPVLVHGSWDIDKQNIPSDKVSKEGAIERWRHLSGVDLPELQGCDVMLLIGSDMAHLLIQLEVRRGRWDKSIAIKNPLGWTLFGNLSSGHCETINTNFLATNEGTQLQLQIERFWDIDSYATKQVLSESPLLAEDKRALAILQNSTTKANIKQRCCGNMSQTSQTIEPWRSQDSTPLRGIIEESKTSGEIPECH